MRLVDVPILLFFSAIAFLITGTLTVGLPGMVRAFWKGIK
jgi:hypothetical protein